MTEPFDALPPTALRLAAAAWPLDWHADWEAMSAKLARWIQEAASAGCHIAVLPEYAGLEAAFTGSRAHSGTAEWCARAASVSGRYAALVSTLAQRHGLWILAGSLPTWAAGRLVNRAWLCAPEGRVTAHDKQILTPWERRETPLCPGAPSTAQQMGALRLGALVCYDSEFPPLARALGADLLLIPSCTEARHGDTRVRVAARARALEGQAVTLHAPLLGAIPECEIVDTNTGTAGIYGPPDAGFPDDGVLARGAPDSPGWVIAELPRGALSLTRSAGAVAPRAHMAEAETRAAAVAHRPGRQIAP